MSSRSSKLGILKGITLTLLSPEIHCQLQVRTRDKCLGLQASQASARRALAVLAVLGLVTFYFHKKSALLWSELPRMLVAAPTQPCVGDRALSLHAL